jgi:hypothetical protein
VGCAADLSFENDDNNVLKIFEKYFEGNSSAIFYIS